MKGTSRTVGRGCQVDSAPAQRHLYLVDLLVDIRAELMEHAGASGLKVRHPLLEAESLRDHFAVLDSRGRSRFAKRSPEPPLNVNGGCDKSTPGV